MPTFAGISVVIFFAAMGLPGLCGFIGEVLVVLAAWNYSMVLATVAASVVILTAGYILWTIQRVYLGPEYKGPHAEALTPMSHREIAIAVPLVVLALVLGIFPTVLLKYTGPTVDRLADDLSAYTQRSGIAAAPPAARMPLETSRRVPLVACPAVPATRIGKLSGAPNRAAKPSAAPGETASEPSDVLANSAARFTRNTDHRPLTTDH